MSNEDFHDNVISWMIALQVVFILLKMTGCVTWGWPVVFIPLLTIIVWALGIVITDMR